MSALRDQVIQATRQWLERFVIGLDLCPFAALPYRRQRIAYRVSDACEQEEIYRDFLGAVQELFDADPLVVETTLLVCSRGLRDFAEYLELAELAEQALAEAGLEAWVQLATFHPDYVFADSLPEDPADYSNRSPYPMFHLIRADGMAAALETYPDAEAIPQRNVARLRALGMDAIRMLLDEVGGAPQVGGG